ncbi:MAG: sigma-70 family RNA polymerase sigma factor [Planctomycetota bacterium]
MQTPPADHTLIEQIQLGDRAALGQLLLKHEKRLFNTALRMVSNRDDAAEVTQEAMLKIIQHIDAYRSEAQITTWMTRIVMNTAVSRLRRRKLRDHVSLDSARPARDGDDQAAALRNVLEDSRELGPDCGVEQGEMIRHLHSAIDRLDVDFRAVLVLRDLREMDYQQIADVLDVKVGTVKSRLFRARLALRQEMQKLERQPDPHPVPDNA